MTDKTVLGTITGELFQPVRLHYRVSDDKGLKQSLAKLSCVKPDPPRQRWVWLYEDEARGLSFKQPYAQISEKLRPIVLGSFIHRTSDTFLLDLRSCERAIAAIPFFDKYIPREVARLTEAEVANKLYPTDGPQLSPEDVFDHQPTTVRDPEFQRLAALVKQGGSIRARLDIALKAIQTATSQPLPDTERIPVHYYEDGIGGFKLALSLRQIVAWKHWSGNAEYTLLDAIKETTKSR